MIDKTATKTGLIADFETAQTGFIASLNKSMEFAFKMGEILSEIKKITPHGKFESVVKCDLQVVFGMRQVQKLMRIAEYREVILESGKTDALTVVS